MRTERGPRAWRGEAGGAWREPCTLGLHASPGEALASFQVVVGVAVAV